MVVWRKITFLFSGAASALVFTAVVPFSENGLRISKSNNPSAHPGSRQMLSKGAGGKFGGGFLPSVKNAKAALPRSP